MIKRATLAAAAILFSFSIVVPAQAAKYFFEVTGDANASFELDSNPTPNESLPAAGFRMYAVPGFFNGSLESLLLTFYSAGFGGGFKMEPNDNVGNQLIATNGPQLYTGPESSPTVLTGTFALTSQFSPSRNYTLTITDLAAAVPEPASWALMLIGFGATGAALRSRRKLAVAFS
jgi:hypothetical protein